MRQKQTHIPVEKQDAKEMSLPPRRVLHPSNKGKLARIFYGSLLLLFVGLVIVLIVWGIHLKESV
ncbi:hypothetical protein [Ferviditalea candida]|uniref:Uncharacterized protein n=1 Tax=Ferviditalea candida TaxID=3108399 RepID=A0ABU5ZJU8_9BACL|nr:hypothetical protein [Paenibacillaceae bacterium T2]